MKTKVRLAARMELPDAEDLAKAGWDIEKTATPDPKDRSEKSLAEDGKKASDEPADAKIVADQREPVISGKKESERTIRREEIIESDGPQAERQTEDDEGVDNSNHQDLNQQENEVSNDPFRSSSSVLAALKVAELEQELGLDSQWEVSDKFARVASLEGLSDEQLSDRIQTLSQVKQAGLSRPKEKKSNSLPRFTAGRTVEKESSEQVDAPDYAIFN